MKTLSVLVWTEGLNGSKCTRFQNENALVWTSLVACVACVVTGYVVVQFYLWFKFYFPLFLGMVMYDNEFETKENKI